MRTPRIYLLAALAAIVVVVTALAVRAEPAHAMSMVLRPPAVKEMRVQYLGAWTTTRHTAMPDLDSLAGALARAYDDGTLERIDSLSYRVRWSRVENALGAADHYRLTVRDSATRAIVHAAELPGSQLADTVTVPAPAWGKRVVLVAELVAVRRSLASTPAYATWGVSRADAAPPAPVPSVDTLPILVGVGPGEPCRPLVATVLGHISGDTAYFARAVPEIPSTAYCVGPDLAVLLEGDVVGLGDPAPPPGDSITTYVYPPRAVLPTVVPAPLPRRAGA